jgi:hypothetical protein
MACLFPNDLEQAERRIPSRRSGAASRLGDWSRGGWGRRDYHFWNSRPKDLVSVLEIPKNRGFGSRGYKVPDAKDCRQRPSVTIVEAITKCDGSAVGPHAG